jgi:hypothetical protein
MAKYRSITKISKDLEDVTTTMKKLAKDYGKASGQAKDKIVAQLKKLTKDKQDLEHELQGSVGELDKDVQLQVDEVRNAIKNIVREELNKSKRK